jgi:hypothetical protein
MAQSDSSGKTASYDHYRVMVSVSRPEDNYGWSIPALLKRIDPDVELGTEAELAQVLSDLEADGIVHQPVEGVYQMTPKALDVITAPLPEAAVATAGPATIDVSAAATSLNSTPSGATDVQA